MPVVIEEFQLWSRSTTRLRERGALAHRGDDLAVGQRAYDIVLIGERETLDRDLDAARPHPGPIGHGERDALVIV